MRRASGKAAVSVALIVMIANPPRSQGGGGVPVPTMPADEPRHDRAERHDLLGRDMAADEFRQRPVGGHEPGRRIDGPDARDAPTGRRSAVYSSVRALVDHPGEPGGVLDAEIHASGANRRVDVRGVAGEEHFSLLVGVGLSVGDAEGGFPRHRRHRDSRRHLAQHVALVADEAHEVAANRDQHEEHGRRDPRRGRVERQRRRDACVGEAPFGLIAAAGEIEPEARRTAECAPSAPIRRSGVTVSLLVGPRSSALGLSGSVRPTSSVRHST